MEESTRSVEVMGRCLSIVFSSRHVNTSRFRSEVTICVSDSIVCKTRYQNVQLYNMFTHHNTSVEQRWCNYDILGVYKLCIMYLRLVRDRNNPTARFQSLRKTTKNRTRSIHVWSMWTWIDRDTKWTPSNCDWCNLCRNNSLCHSCRAINNNYYTIINFIIWLSHIEMDSLK